MQWFINASHVTISWTYLVHDPLSVGSQGQLEVKRGLPGLLAKGDK